jgi:tetratricopeptide (TPR) repeat protein
VRIGLFHEAIQDYTMALKTDPKNLQYLHNRGVCFERIHEYNKAVEDFTEEINLSNCSTSYFIRGYCYDSMGELELALKDYSAALQK